MNVLDSGFSKQPGKFDGDRLRDGLRYEAAHLFDEGKPCGAEANMAKHLASEASWAAANAALDTHGGNGFVDQYDIERTFRETRLGGAVTD